MKPSEIVILMVAESKGSAFFRVSKKLFRQFCAAFSELQMSSERFCYSKSVRTVKGPPTYIWKAGIEPYRKVPAESPGHRKLL